MPSTLGIVASGEDVFNDAVLWLDTARSVANETTMVNYGKGGSALNATYGSSAGADTNDPLLLVHSGTNYLYLPGGSNSVNFASFPDDGTTFVGDVSVAVRYDPGNRNEDRVLVIKRASGVDGALIPFSFSQWNTGTGRLKFIWTDTAGTTHSLFGVTNVPSTAKWVGVQHDHDNGAGGNTAHFYWSADETNPTWTLLESITETFVDPAGKRVNTAQIGVGGTNVGVYGAFGGYYEAKIWNSMTFAGTPQAHIDFTTGITSGAQTTFTATTGQTVTINRATSGRKSVAVVRNVLLFGTDDYLEIADNDLLDFGASDSFTVMAVVRQWNTPTSFGRTFGKLGATGAGWVMLNNSTSAQRYLSITDGTTTLNAGVTNPYTVGALAVTTAVRNTAADNVTLYSGNSALTPATDTTTGTLANSSPLRVGAASAGGSFQDFEVVAVAIWRRALSTNEIATAVARYA